MTPLLPIWCSLFFALFAAAQFDYEIKYASTNLATVPLAVTPFDSFHLDSSSAPQKSYLFTCPRGRNVTNPGPTIYKSDTGEVIWFGAQAGMGQSMDLKVQYYQGKRVINVWDGQYLGPFGSGYVMLFDESYKMVANVTGDGGFDFHEFQIVNDGSNNATVMVIAYKHRQVDLVPAGGPSDGWIVDSWIQEIDIETSEVKFEWSCYDHLNITEGEVGLSGDSGTSENTAWDTFHINSVEKDQHGNYLISSRQYHQVIYIEGSSGNVLWGIGGKADYGFTMDNGTEFYYQHHARWHANQTLMTVYDNAGSTGDIREDQARGLLLSVDQENKHIGLVQEFLPSSAGFGENGAGNYTISQGSIQRLDNGNIVVGYGIQPWTAEYLENGTAIYAASLAWEGANIATVGVQNYRAHMSSDWVGKPYYPPNITLDTGDDNITLTTTWNGATEISLYTFFLGTSETIFETQNNVTRTGYETQWIGPAGDSQYAVVAAFNSSGSELGRTGVMNLADGSMVSEGSVSYDVSSDSNPDSPSSENGSTMSRKVNRVSGLVVAVVVVFAPLMSQIFQY